MTLDASAIIELRDLAQEADVPKTISIGEYTYAKDAAGALVRVNEDPQAPKTLEFFTLQAFADYLKAEDEDTRPLVHVVSPVLVEAVSKLYGGDEHLRRVPARAVCTSAVLKGFAFNTPVALEALNIALQTCFAPDLGDIIGIRKFCAAVRATAEIGTADDGVSQEVQAKRGVAAIQNTPVNNPWQLAPFRTFSEVPQPLSPFVLRFRESEGAPVAGLYETGDARWQVDAVKAIARQLRVLLGTGELAEGEEGWTVLG